MIVKRGFVLGEIKFKELEIIAAAKAEPLEQVIAEALSGGKSIPNFKFEKEQDQEIQLRNTNTLLKLHMPEPLFREISEHVDGDNDINFVMESRIDAYIEEFAQKGMELRK